MGEAGYPNVRLTFVAVSSSSVAKIWTNETYSTNNLAITNGPSDTVRDDPTVKKKTTMVIFYNLHSIGMRNTFFEY